jgi:DNA-binding CsgD family transcriptional regulator
MIKKIQSLLLKSTAREGNVALITAIGVVTATMAVYFFISVRNISIERQQKITHLNNAVEMANAVKYHISGKAFRMQRLGTKTKTEIQNEVGSNYEDGAVITLSRLITDGLIIEAMDPTKSFADGAEISYSTTNSTVTVTYGDSNGSALSGAGETVETLVLNVVLAASGDSHDYIDFDDILSLGTPPNFETDVTLE